MKILKANAGALTNFEVLDFLRSRGAGKDATRVIAPVAPSEYKVFDYLEQSVACYQTKESITDFISKSEKYKLAKAEILNVINIRPSSGVEIFSIVEDCDGRFGENIDELVDMVAEVFPLPTPIETDDGVTQEADLPTPIETEDGVTQEADLPTPIETEDGVTQEADLPTPIETEDGVTQEAENDAQPS